MKFVYLNLSIEYMKSLKKIGFKLYLVGGAVRDTLIGRHPKDFDLATDAVPNKVKENVTHVLNY